MVAVGGGDVGVAVWAQEADGRLPFAPRKYWQQAVGMDEDVIGGRCPSWQTIVSAESSHRFARARPQLGPAGSSDVAASAVALR